jgi:hypothetical protein
VRLSVKEEFAGSIPAPGALRQVGKGKPTGDGTRLENGRAMSLEGSTPSPSAAIEACSWPIGEAPVFQTGQAGSTPAEHFSPNPEMWSRVQSRNDLGQSLLVVTPASEAGGRWFDSSPRNSGSSARRRLGRQPADHSRSDREMLRVRIPPGPLAHSTRPRGAAWSARHTVKVETVGSNPTGGADLFRSDPAGSRPVRLSAGHLVLSQERRVRLPHGLLEVYWTFPGGREPRRPS